MQRVFEAAALARRLSDLGNGDHQTLIRIELTEHGFNVVGKIFAMREVGHDYSAVHSVLAREVMDDPTRLSWAVRNVAQMLGINE